jgi:hypothetical protein
LTAEQHIKHLTYLALSDNIISVAVDHLCEGARHLGPVLHTDVLEQLQLAEELGDSLVLLRGTVDHGISEEHAVQGPHVTFRQGTDGGTTGGVVHECEVSEAALLHRCHNGPVYDDLSLAFFQYEELVSLLAFSDNIFSFLDVGLLHCIDYVFEFVLLELAEQEMTLENAQDRVLGLVRLRRSIP